MEEQLAKGKAARHGNRLSFPSAQQTFCYIADIW